MRWTVESIFIHSPRTIVGAVMSGMCVQLAWCDCDEIQPHETFLPLFPLHTLPLTKVLRWQADDSLTGLSRVHYAQLSWAFLRTIKWVMLSATDWCSFGCDMTIEKFAFCAWIERCMMRMSMHAHDTHYILVLSIYAISFLTSSRRHLSLDC